MAEDGVYRTGIGGHGVIEQNRTGVFRRLFFDRPMLLIVRRGTKRLEHEGTAAEGGPGTALAVQPGVFVTVTNTTDGGLYRAEALPIDPALVEPSARPAVPAVAAFPATPGLEAATGAARRALHDAALPDAIVAHRFREILLWLAEAGVVFALPAAESFALRTRRLVAGDPAAPWPAAAVADRLATSVPTLRRHLAAEGTTLTDILADVRLAAALNMLQTTRRPVTAIALDCGYASPSRFAMRFRARFGLSPSEVRAEPAGFDRIGAVIDRRGAAADAGSGQDRRRHPL